MIDDVRVLAEEHGLKFGISELHREPLDILDRAGVVSKVGLDMIFDDLGDAAAAFNASRKVPA